MKNKGKELCGWQYYNHSLMPVTPPYEKADTSPIESGAAWKYTGGGIRCWPVGRRISTVGRKRSGGTALRIRPLR